MRFLCSILFRLRFDFPCCYYPFCLRNLHFVNIGMSTRSREISRSKSQPKNTTNSSTPSRNRVRWNSARDKSSPYGSFTRHPSSNNNELSSATSRHSNNNENGLTGEHISQLHSSDAVQVQQVIPNEQNNNEQLPQNASDSTITVEEGMVNSYFQEIQNALHVITYF